MKSTMLQYTYNVVKTEKITTKSRKVKTPTDFIFTF